MMKSTLLLVILLIVLAEGSFKDRFSHIRKFVTPGGRPGQMRTQQNCEGRLEFIAVPSNNTAELNAVWQQKGNLHTLLRRLTLVDGVRSRQSYEAKSYGNCCWILYSK